MKLIEALNAVNTPLLAIVVILVGCGYGIACHTWGMTNDGPSAIIGAGIGLLTGQALSGTKTQSAPPTNIAPPPLQAPAVVLPQPK